MIKVIYTSICCGFILLHRIVWVRMDGLSLLLSILVLVVSLATLFQRSKNRSHTATLVDQFPGPRKYPLVGSILPILIARRSDGFLQFVKIATQYPPVFRFWTGPRPEVHVIKPEYVEIVLNSTKHLDKAQPYEFLHPWLGTGLLTSTGRKWHLHRKMITPTFHFNILNSFVEVFSEKSEILVKKLRKEVGSPGFNVFPYVTKCALDIICETAMGTQIFAQDGENSDYVTAVYDMGELTMYRQLAPWLHPDFIYNLTAGGRRQKQCLKVLHGFTNQVIRERKAQMSSEKESRLGLTSSEDESVGKKKRKVFLDLLLESSVDGVKLTDEELREEVDTFMFEGHDTTSAGMCWAIFLLGLHPNVQEEAQKEQDSIFQGSNRSATMKDLNEMKYLERVIKESLRLYPSVPMIARVASEDIKIEENTIPEGCTIVLHTYIQHRNPEHFPDPEKFNPDRFLPEVVAKRHPYAYIPFSAGPRNCIGQKFAILEEKTVLSYILRNYTIRSLDKREDIKLLCELVLRSENGLNIALTPREKHD